MQVVSIPDMDDLFIVYGSESRLLIPLFNRPNTFFLRIYNVSVPKKKRNAIDVDNFEEFKVVFKDLLENNDFGKIVFIGAAFKVQNQLFFGETMHDIDQMIEINITSYIKYTHFLLPFMLKLKRGNFVYLSSFRSQQTSKGVSIYSSSKAFGEKFFEVIGKEYGSKGVYATSIRMGYFDGKMLEKLDKKDFEKIVSLVGNKRLGNSVDILNVIEYIIKNDFTNGSILELTGGINYN